MTHRSLHMQLNVVLAPDVTNFVRLPKAFAESVRRAMPAKAHGVVALRLGWLLPPNEDSGGVARPCQAFVGWTDALADGHFLQVPLGLAEALGLKEAVEFAQSTAPDEPLILSVSVVPYAPVAARVDVDPVTPDDWEILELHANLVEEELLSQICVLGPGQQFPMWVHGRTRINMRVSSIAMIEQQQAVCVRLARNTEVVVAPKLRQRADRFQAQSLMQNELDREEGTRALALRVQDCSVQVAAAEERGGAAGDAEAWNGVAAVHPSALDKLVRAAKWPALKALPGGDVVFAADTTKPVVALLGHKRRNTVLGKLHRRKRREAPPAKLQSVLNQAFVKLRVSEDAAPGHVMLSSATCARCRLEVLGSAVLSLPRFEPLACPDAFPPMCVRLTPVLGQADVDDGACLDQLFRRDATLAAQRWQSRLRPQAAAGVPLSDGALLRLQLGPGNGLTRSGERAVFLVVNVEDPTNGEPGAGSGSGSGSGAKPATLEPVHWLVRGDSKIEWRVERFAVDTTMRKLELASCPSASEPGPEAGWARAPASPSGRDAAVAAAPAAAPQPASSVSADDTGSAHREGLASHNAAYFADVPLAELGAVDDVAARALDRLRPVLDREWARQRVALGAPHPGGVYLCGARGAGKTAVAKALARELRCSVASLARTVWVSCAQLRGSKRSEVEKTIAGAFKQALASAPALVVLDDLDLLLPAPAGGGGGGEGTAGGDGEDGQLVWLAEWLEDVMNEYQRKLEQFEDGERSRAAVDADFAWASRGVSWLATGREKRSLRGSLLGTGLFDLTLEIKPLTAHDRSAVLEALLLRCGEGLLRTGIDLEEVAAHTEGYAPADLEILLQRAVHRALAREDDKWQAANAAGTATADSEESDPEDLWEYDAPTSQNPATAATASYAATPPALLQEDLVAATEGFTPAALRGVSLAKSEVAWDDVGGLREVRQVLKETLELPIQFAPLYDRSPQRLASGVLLYGPPGCGKTLLAGAVAKECGLNFISVKGPEVLNKYIGASEQAVRDLFARGAAAAPCIVFFDEFDAVAPRRGNDSSGVTDRVVNQLLTFLDGVEVCAGVYVMAATSRPDLVDPALLRPGRLDKQLLCGFPDAEERTDILRTIARKMQLTPDAEAYLGTVAELPEAEMFTGADLQALLYSAQLDAVHSGLDAPSESATAAAAGAPEEARGAASGAASASHISVAHLRKAVDDARPSVSKEDRARFTRIYDAFTGGRGADFNAVSGYADGRQRTALK